VPGSAVEVFQDCSWRTFSFLNLATFAGPCNFGFVLLSGPYLMSPKPLFCYLPQLGFSLCCLVCLRGWVGLPGGCWVCGARSHEFNFRKDARTRSVPFRPVGHLQELGGRLPTAYLSQVWTPFCCYFFLFLRYREGPFGPPVGGRVRWSGLLLRRAFHLCGPGFCPVATLIRINGGERNQPFP